MRNFIKDHRFLAGLLSIFVSVFLVSIVTYAATTIGTNINTAGTVTMESASTTNDFWLGNVIADDDDYLYFDASGTEYLMWDDSLAEFVISGGLHITGGASTTNNFWLGNVIADDDDYLYFDASGTEYLMWDDSVTEFVISDDFRVTGTASSTSATTTDYLYVGPDGSEGSNFNFADGDLYVADDVEIDGTATTTGSHYIGGTASTTELYVQGAAHIGGNADVDGTFTIGTSTVIEKISFGTCNIAATTVNASSTAYVECTSATGARPSDMVFVTATSSLPVNFIIQAASSTNADEISLRIFNTGSIEGTATDVRTFFWQAIR